VGIQGIKLSSFLVSENWLETCKARLKKVQFISQFTGQKLKKTMKKQRYSYEERLLIEAQYSLMTKRQDYLLSQQPE